MFIILKLRLLNLHKIGQFEQSFYFCFKLSLYVCFPKTCFSMEKLNPLGRLIERNLKLNQFALRLSLARLCLSLKTSVGMIESMS